MESNHKQAIPNSDPKAREAVKQQEEIEPSPALWSEAPPTPVIQEYIPFVRFPTIATSGESGTLVEVEVELVPAAPLPATPPVPSNEPDRQVQVVMSPEHLVEEDDQVVQELRVPPYEGSPSVTFRLTPGTMEQRRLAVDFYHGHRIVGTTHIPPQPTGQPLPVIDLKPCSVPPADLEIRIILGADGRRLHYVLHSPHADLRYHWKSAGERDLGPEPSEWVDGLFEEMGLGFQTPGRGPREFTMETLGQVGERIYEDLFSAGMKYELRRIGDLIGKGRLGSLLITSDESWIPWELVKLPAGGTSPSAAENFLAAQVPLGRWLSGYGIRGEMRVNAAQVIIPNWGDVNLSDSVGMRERDYFITLPHREESFPIKVRRPSSEIGQLSAKLKSGRTQLYHLIAVGGVSYSAGSAGQISIRLGDGTLGQLDAEMSEGIGKTQPLVFLSTHCMESGTPNRTGLGAWAEQFVRAGAAVFAGTWWEVQDQAAAVFAETFYDALWQGETLGEAFKKGRIHVMRSLPKSPDWLAFALWGDPNGRVFLGKDPWTAEQAAGDLWSADKPDGLPEDRSGPPLPPSDRDDGISKGGMREEQTSVASAQTAPPPSTETDSAPPTEPPVPLPLDARIWFLVAGDETDPGGERLFKQGIGGIRLVSPHRILMLKGDMALVCSAPPRQEVMGIGRIAADYGYPGPRVGPAIESLVRFESPLSLDELRELAPGLAYLRNPETAASQVTPSEWDRIRHAIVTRNPDLALRLPTAHPDISPALKADVQATATAEVLKGRLSTTVVVINAGNVAFRYGERLHIAYRWLRESEKGEVPVLEGETEPDFGHELPPGREDSLACEFKSPAERTGRYIVEWTISSECWGDMMPAQTGRFMLAWSWNLQLREPEGEIAPRTVVAGKNVAPRIQIENAGTLPVSSADELFIALSWTVAGESPAEPYLRLSPIPLGAEIPAGASMVWTLPELEAPRVPGSYNLLAALLSLDMEEIDSISLVFTVGDVPPAFAGRVEFINPPPQSMWPGEKFTVAVRAGNDGSESWEHKEVQIRSTLEPGDEESSARKRHHFHWVQATEPGAAAEVAFSCAAPLAPGSHTLAIVLGKQEVLSKETLPVELPRIAAAFSVIEVSGLSLAELQDKAPDGITTEAGAVRLRQMGERLKDETLKDEDIERKAREQILEHLFSDSVIVCRAAVETLAELGGRDPSLDRIVNEAVAGRGEDLGRLPGRLMDKQLSDTAREWLNRLLPAPAVKEARDTAGRRIIELGRFATSQPEYQTPDIRVVVKIGPERISLTCGNDVYMSENLLQEASTRDCLAVQEGISARAFGEALFGAIFNTKHAGGKGPTYDGYVIARKKANHRLCLELQIDPEVGSYKWEYLCNPHERVQGQPAPPLAVYADAPFYRRCYNNQADTAVDARPLRLLVAVCNPLNLGKQNHQGEMVPPYIAGLTPLQVDAEIKVLERGLERLKREAKAEYRFLGHAGDDPLTFERLMKTLKEGFHVLHIVGHGVMVNGKYYLLMEDDRRRAVPIPPEKFQSPAFRQHLRLAVLASCQSARREEEAQRCLPSLAERLVKQGVLAVIAMQDVVSIEAAQLFTQCFYDDLARTGRIDMAMAAARFSLYRHKPQWWDWGMPVLFMSTSNGALLRVDERLASMAADTRMPLPELEQMLEPAAKLLNEQDLAAKVLSNSLSSQVQAAYPNPELIARLQSAILPSGAVIPPKVPPLAKRQARSALQALKEVNFVGSQLAAHVETQCRMKISSRVFHQVASALNSGKHIVLTGPPGTGKTTLAEAICSHARKEVRCAPGYTLVTATSDWTTFDTVGGLMPVQGGVLQFKPGKLLQAIADGYWVIIDEINRAEIDKAFGELFTVLSGQQVELVHRVEEQPVRIIPGSQDGSWDGEASAEGYDYVVHPSWRIIGTMNVYDKSYLFNMSFAFMRRFAFIDVDLPDQNDYLRLVDGWLDDFKLPKQNSGLPDWLHNLIGRETTLMKRRAVGPAILQDMLRYMGNRLQAEGRRASDYTEQSDPNDLLQYLAEAFQLYVSPQLDGLDRQSIKEVYGETRDLFSPLRDAATEAYKELYSQTLRRIKQLYPHFTSDEWEDNPQN